MIKLTIEQKNLIAGLIFQADMSIVRALSYSEMDLLFRFYNPSRLDLITRFLNEVEQKDFSNYSVFNVLANKIKKNENCFVCSQWFYSSISLLKTLVFYVENNQMITQEIWVSLRTLFMYNSTKVRSRFLESNTIYFARHDLSEEVYIDTANLWVSEI